MSQPSTPRAGARAQIVTYFLLVGLGLLTLLVLASARGQLAGILACSVGLILACVGAAPLLGAYARRQRGRDAHLSGRSATWGTLLLVCGLALAVAGVVVLVSG